MKIGCEAAMLKCFLLIFCLRQGQEKRETNSITAEHINCGKLSFTIMSFLENWRTAWAIKNGNLLMELHVATPRLWLEFEGT